LLKLLFLGLVALFWLQNQSRAPTQIICFRC